MTFQTFKVTSGELPPCEDCLFMHVLCANYQASILKSCLQCQVQNGQLAIEWMRSFPAPDAVGNCSLASVHDHVNGLNAHA